MDPDIIEILQHFRKTDNVNLSIESLRLWRLLLRYEVGLDSIAGAQLILLSQLQLLLSNHDIQNTSELACEHAAALVAVASREKSLKPIISTLLAKWSTQLSAVSNVTVNCTTCIRCTTNFGQT